MSVLNGIFWQQMFAVVEATNLAGKSRRKISPQEIVRRVARWFIFKPKIPILGKFWRALDWKMLIYFMAIWNICISDIWDIL
jgi:hypothetical protein